ncbi:SRPBCC family protein [Paenisporosarcina macmurdoensis]|uniref:SRPBCC family protein n=1 Tax=Paenisporosarcina macmurdoensis TaxID=212659 RepID=A0ABW1L924_9BACL
MEIQVNTKLKIAKPVNEVFEALVDPTKMANYWFSSGSGRLEQDKTITWRYEEYNAEVELTVLEIQDNQNIVFKWGAPGDEHVVTITLNELDHTTTIIEVNEKGWNENDNDLISNLLGNKEGWVYMLTCLKGYLENGITNLRAAIVF